MTAQQLLRKYPDADREVVARCDERLGNTTRGALYVQSREQGNDDRWASMLALRRVARGMTDDVALSGLDTVAAMAERNPAFTKRLVALAEAQGYHVKPTDHYVPTLAVCEGDPAAFVNHGQGRGHIKKVLESRGMEAHGMVTTAAREPESDPWEKPKHKLHPRIVERIRKQRLKQNPELAHKNQAELRADIVATHGMK